VTRGALRHRLLEALDWRTDRSPAKYVRSTALLAVSGALACPRTR